MSTSVSCHQKEYKPCNERRVNSTLMVPRKKKKICDKGTKEIQELNDIEIKVKVVISL